jgi:outer membrane protein OmpA-like peptidoglycan-associated protein
MTPNFLKSTTAIVLSLSLAVPHMALAQTAAELEAELNVDTSNMTEAELDTLRKQLADQKAQAEAATTATAQAEAEAPVQREVTPEAQAESQVAPESAAPEATAEDKSMLDRAVGAVTGGIEKLTGADEAEADAQANTEATAEAPAQGSEQGEAAVPKPAPDATAETTAQGNAQVETPAPQTETTSDTQSAAATGAAPETQPKTEAEASAQTETDVSGNQAADTATAETAPSDAAGNQNQLEAQVQELQKKLDALSSESAGEQAARQAATEAAEAEAQSTSMAATASEAEAEAAEVIEQTVTEDTARSSSEEFATTAGAETATTAQPQQKSGLDEFGRAALIGLGALAVGSMLKNGSQVVSNSGDRVVVQQQDGSYKVLKNDDTLMFQPGTDVKTYAFSDGSTRTVATRENGVQIETIRAADGTVLRRTRILPDGSAVILFDDTQVAQQVDVNTLPQVTQSRNSINFQQAQEDELRAALEARLPEQVDRRFSLSQVRNINAVRQLVPEIDVDSINFETGSAVIRPEEAQDLATLGTLMRERIEANPSEVFLIEGHTDAVGSASYNLALSDRRAESVALALSEYFDVPPENMVVQGYGEADLKIRTATAERENRRAAVRRITDLLTGS